VNRQQTLEQATACVMKDRQASHGKPEDSFALIAKFWSAYLGIEIAPHQVAELMVLLKVARAKLNKVNEDNRVDIAGYAACAAELAPQPKKASESFWSKPVTMVDANGRELPSTTPPSRNNPGEAPLPATILQHNS
jgi:hypothetical protein